jgi:hypothetical protein
MTARHQPLSALKPAALAACLTAVVGCAGPAATPIPPEQIPAAFIALSQATDRTMHMEWTGTYAMGDVDAATMPISGTFDFAGDDYAGTITTEVGIEPGAKPGAGSNSIEIAVVGGQGYQRPTITGASGWQKTSDQPRTVDPLRGLTAVNIDYVGRETLNGRDLHHLRVRELSALLGTLFAGLSKLPTGLGSFDTASSSFDIWVDADAVPVSANLKLATGNNPTDFGVISMDSSYEFSNWGAEIYIVAPP